MPNLILIMLKNKLKLWSEFKSIFARNYNNSKEIKVELYHIQNCIMSKFNFAAGWKSAFKRHTNVNELRNVESKNILNILNILNYERIKC